MKNRVATIQDYCGQRYYGDHYYQAKDQEGRTPLHYAAALHDSGIFYHYILKCGADELIQDKVGISIRKREPTEKKQFMMPTSATSPMGPPDQHYTPDN